ncbi:hypothetical protein MesoLjLc_12780 [Mesorhizobium sp. L-8-10]|nr:hypothetical protein MesoLjLc_12780 [Mesorhizobium sp. L-8-10]
MITKWPLAITSGWVRVERLRTIRTIAGSALTLEKAVAVMPCGLPSCSVVTTVTPATIDLMIERKDAPSIGARLERTVLSTWQFMFVSSFCGDVFCAIAVRMRRCVAIDNAGSP